MMDSKVLPEVFEVSVKSATRQISFVYSSSINSSYFIITLYNYILLALRPGFERGIFKRDNCEKISLLLCFVVKKGQTKKKQIFAFIILVGIIFHRSSYFMQIHELSYCQEFNLK